MDFIFDNWQWVLFLFYVLEKVVLISKAKWDDIVVSAVKALCIKLYNAFGRP